MAPASKWTSWLLWNLRMGWTTKKKVSENTSPSPQWHHCHARPVLSVCDWQHLMHSSQFCSKSALTLSFLTQESSQFLRNSAALAAPIAFWFAVAICHRCLLYTPKGLTLKFYRDKLPRILAQFLETSCLFLGRGRNYANLLLLCTQNMW